jgi:hypothetical protein
MRRLPTWLILGAVGILVALAAADAIRPHAEARPAPSTTAQAAPDLRGHLVFADDDCNARAVRLPDLVRERPIDTDCDGRRWSRDGSLMAVCRSDHTDVFAGFSALPVSTITGCAPAWREDGALSVIRHGDLVVARRYGRPRVSISKQQLVKWLDGRLASGDGWRPAEVAWIDRTNLAAILQGPRLAEQAVAIMSADGLELFVPEFGQRIEDLRVSPRGDVAFARARLDRTYSMLRRNGNEVPLPMIANAHALTWSPDERWVAIATRTTTFISPTGTRELVRQIPFGGDSLDWRP